MINKYILNGCRDEGFSEDDMYGAYKIFFGTLVSESRLKMLNLLQGSRKNVSQIMKSLGMSQTAVSHDLARLKKCGFVQSAVEGPYRYYSINESTIKPLLEIIVKHMGKHCTHILKAGRRQ